MESDKSKKTRNILKYIERNQLLNVEIHSTIHFLQLLYNVQWHLCMFNNRLIRDTANKI